ncbi:MAG: cytochrome c oxidase subunit II [Chloroflexi bacterium GWC2_73_18]|nr:MAG: cytochrome c oxidase subunit II [Chloroflexi bacterium GWC2_73_18]
MPSPGATRRRGSIAARLARLGLPAAAAFLVAGCSSLLPPEPVTSQGRDIEGLYYWVFGFAAVIFLAVEAVIVWLVVRYRRRDDHLPAQTHGNNAVEVLWTAIPLVIVLFLFVISWQSLERIKAGPLESADVRVRVVAFQFGWRFEYADGFTVQGTGFPGPRLVVPVDSTVRLQLHSDNVIHAFYVPQFLSKLDVVPQSDPERDNVFEFRPEKTGVYRGQCAEFCGLAHNTMHFEVEVKSQPDYRAWVARQLASQGTPGPSVSPPPGAVTLEIGADTVLAFDRDRLGVAPNTPFVIAFDNRQAGVPHNVSIRDASGTVVFQGKPDVTGPAKAQYVSPAGLPAGTYEFYCSIHPNMKGTFEVK